MADGTLKRPLPGQFTKLRVSQWRAKTTKWEPRQQYAGWCLGASILLRLLLARLISIVPLFPIIPHFLSLQLHQDGRSNESWSHGHGING